MGAVLVEAHGLGRAGLDLGASAPRRSISASHAAAASGSGSPSQGMARSLGGSGARALGPAQVSVMKRMPRDMAIVSAHTAISTVSDSGCVLRIHPHTWMTIMSPHTMEIRSKTKR